MSFQAYRSEYSEGYNLNLSNCSISYNTEEDAIIINVRNNRTQDYTDFVRDINLVNELRCSDKPVYNKLKERSYNNVTIKITTDSNNSKIFKATLTLKNEEKVLIKEITN